MLYCGVAYGVATGEIEYRVSPRRMRVFATGASRWKVGLCSCTLDLRSDGLIDAAPVIGC